MLDVSDKRVAKGEAMNELVYVKVMQKIAGGFLTANIEVIVDIVTKYSIKSNWN